jgi:hypothetical protein
MDEATKLGFTFAKEVATTLITLSTGLLTLSITFAREVLKSVPKGREHVLKAAWGMHICSMICGVWAVSALTGDLMPMNPANRTLTLGANVRVPATAQVLAFLLGTILLALVYYGKRQPQTKCAFRFLRARSSEESMHELTVLTENGWEIVNISLFATGSEYLVVLKKPQ